MNQFIIIGKVLSRPCLKDGKRTMFVETEKGSYPIGIWETVSEAISSKLSDEMIVGIKGHLEISDRIYLIAERISILQEVDHK